MTDYFSYLGFGRQVDVSVCVGDKAAAASESGVCRLGPAPLNQPDSAWCLGVSVSCFSGCFSVGAMGASEPLSHGFGNETGVSEFLPEEGGFRCCNTPSHTHTCLGGG